MPFSKTLPEWNAVGSVPPDSKKNDGWGVDEKPPADWFNWFFNTAYLALQELQQNAVHNEKLGVVNGIALLDANGKVLSSSMPTSGINATSITQDATHRFATDTEKTTWNAKLDASGYTANDVLTKIKTVDGSGSGVDADLVDGIHFRVNNGVLQYDDGSGWKNMAGIKGVQRGQTSVLGTVDVTIASVDLNKAFITLYHGNSGSTWSGRGYLTSSTNLRLITTTSAGVAFEVDWEVVEFY